VLGNTASVLGKTGSVLGLKLYWAGHRGLQVAAA